MPTFDEDEKEKMFDFVHTEKDEIVRQKEWFQKHGSQVTELVKLYGVVKGKIALAIILAIIGAVVGFNI